MDYLRVLPLAFVMVAGPQILSAIFLATSEDWRRNSAAFVLGATISISLVVTVTYFSGVGASRQGASRGTLHAVVLVVLLVAMVQVYRERAESEPPAWMGKLGAASPRFSFRLGFLLMGFFPSDLLTSVAVGSHLAGEGSPLSHAAGFLALTLLFLALPSLAVLALGRRAERWLPAARDWMNANSWIVNEAVLLLFVAMTLSDLVG
ncbi:GAP family protein [Halalkalicoccus sp. NIPERK01]|uniref:GAP family protein n=1 Tax=Halalkalicoccus sp. NIPERK01 TaxID=3053469 RepID=UPI00256EE898|nr:GAP family protein [Halalkalicoccus sp. NIPERK01]MDL5361564.1 GAP family protein [Halalkalicoccus sp. NIPERK01]